MEGEVSRIPDRKNIASIYFPLKGLKNITCRVACSGVALGTEPLIRTLWRAWLFALWIGPSRLDFQAESYYVSGLRAQVSNFGWTRWDRSVLGFSKAQDAAWKWETFLNMVFVIKPVWWFPSFWWKSSGTSVGRQRIVVLSRLRLVCSCNRWSWDKCVWCK